MFIIPALIQSLFLPLNNKPDYTGLHTHTHTHLISGGRADIFRSYKIVEWEEITVYSASQENSINIHEDFSCLLIL